MAGALKAAHETVSRLALEPVGDEAAGHGAHLTIDLGALADNWRILRDRANPAECSAVVKADAYGIGIEPAVGAFWGAGCRTFFVAHLGEAERVRAVAPAATLYVLNGFPPGSAARYAALDARPVLGSAEEIAEWAGSCDRSGRRLPAAIHVDTGMNRLGLPIEAGLALATDPVLARFEPALVMTHLVAADEPASPVNRRQLDAFATIRAAFPGVPASLANSSGLFLDGAPAYDLARPGYALYGGNPVPGHPNPMRPVLRLDAPILQTRLVGAGETVGYNARWTAPAPRRLATISVGYADGFPRAASATDAGVAQGFAVGAALVGGHLCPFAGRVSMDLIVLDVSAVPDEEVGRGTVATLIGGLLDLDEVGRRAGTIGYEILTGLGRRYSRTYLGG